jgi:glycosyltransferase involved in cell wall biosynthesis
LKSTKPCIWLLSAYRSDSHASWADWLLTHLDHYDWQRLELPGRHFAWRIRGNPLSWLDALPGRSPDLIVATSMVDLATLKGLHPRLARVPSWYYFHENQFAYPKSDAQLSTVEAGMVQLYGALAADRVLFNSEWNRDSFFDGLTALLARLPDHVPGNIVARIEQRSQVLPVPVEPIPPGPDRDPKLIVWNHRWEYDKAPEIFAEAMLALAGRGVAFRLALLGQRGPRSHPALVELRNHLGERIVADGRLDLKAYQSLLGRAGIVVSTARHEFQGMGLIEAVSAGARPLVPDALCYPEQYPASYRYPAGDTRALTQRLAEWLDGKRPGPVDISAWLAAQIGPCWQRALAADLDSVQSTGSSINC